MTLTRSFRKYHRILSIILALPLLLTIVTGMAVTMVGEWGLQFGISRSLLLHIHSGEIFGLEAIYPILDGLGLLGLLVTGLTMTGLFRKRARSRSESR